MSDPMLSRQQPQQQRGKLTHTNTNLLCADTTSNVIVRVIKLGIYRFNLWTGLYMLNDGERWAFHIFGWMCIAAFVFFTYAFVSGFVDGIQGSPSKTLFVNAPILATPTAASHAMFASPSPEL